MRLLPALLVFTLCLSFIGAEPAHAFGRRKRKKPGPVPSSAASEYDVVVFAQDSSGIGFSGATVKLGSQTQTSNQDGYTAFHLPRGTYDLSITAEGYESFSCAGQLIDHSMDK